MSKKLELIKDRKARLATQLAELLEEEKQTEDKNRKRYEQRIVRSFRSNGLLAHEEKIILNEISQMAIRLNDVEQVPVISESESHTIEDKESNNGW